MIAKGDTAPDFEALDQDGKSFRFSSTRGAPTVLYFYPKADTPGCTVEAKGFRDAYAEYQQHQVHVIGVSTDECDEQKAFREKYGLPFPLIADKPQTVGKLYGVLGSTGHARRVSFLIDAQGKVLDVVDSSSPDAHLARARAAFLAK
jgi:thioredoxin-dependent peroxiredoxin